jgi:hypothetical protein
MIDVQQHAILRAGAKPTVDACALIAVQKPGSSGYRTDVLFAGKTAQQQQTDGSCQVKLSLHRAHLSQLILWQRLFMRNDTAVPPNPATNLPNTDNKLTTCMHATSAAAVTAGQRRTQNTAGNAGRHAKKNSITAHLCTAHICRS